MRQHNKYLAKVHEELTVYQKYLLDESTVLTPTQFETFDKISTARAWLKEGYSDSQVLAMLKQSEHLQERRCREVLAMSYGVFAELRSNRDANGIKYLYSEMFKDAYKKAMEAFDFRAAALLLKEAAKIDGAYAAESTQNADQYKRPTKITIKVKSMTVTNNPAEAARQIENTTYELDK